MFQVFEETFDWVDFSREFSKKNIFSFFLFFHFFNFHFFRIFILKRIQSYVELKKTYFNVNKTVSSNIHFDLE